MKRPHAIVATLLEDEDAKDFVERSWVLDANDLKASLAASGFKALAVHVLRNHRWESADDVHVHTYVEGDPNQQFPLDRQTQIAEIVKEWAAAGHSPEVNHYWVPTVITQTEHTYHLDTFIITDPETKILNTDN
jgi:hypothetical protein